MSIDSVDLTKSINLMQGTDKSTIRLMEEKLSCNFSEEYKQFLLRADGGQLTSGVILFSCGTGIHPAERLEPANTNRGDDIPLIFIGRFAEEEFGFKKDDASSASRAVWIYLHEEGDVKRLAGTFEEFIRKQLD